MKYRVGDVIITNHGGMHIYIGKFSKLTFSVDGKIKLIKYNCHVYMPLASIEDSDNYLFDMQRAFTKQLVEMYFNKENISKVATQNRRFAQDRLYSTHSSLKLNTKEFKIRHQNKIVSVYYRKGDTQCQKVET